MNPNKDSTAHGSVASRLKQATDNTHPDLIAAIVAYVTQLPVGFRFTAADLFEFAAPHADDHPSRHGVAIRILQQRQLIEFDGYGPARRPGAWDAPSRHWRRTDVAQAGDAA